jgi:hypothetical protein
VASSDVLAEQVQPNSQITTLRLLLQGANSDQYLTSSSKVVGTRQQATLGFSVSLDPPRQFKHAVAEIRVVIVPPSGSDDISIMTLLPTEKTYNVAKITSHQKSFGAGVAVEAVSVGANTGRSKDRVALADRGGRLSLQWMSEYATEMLTGNSWPTSLPYRLSSQSLALYPVPFVDALRLLRVGKQKDKLPKGAEFPDCRRGSQVCNSLSLPITRY